ncbi:hypothetical protein D1159_18550 [Pseudoflavonifractor sp. 524-17]|uniref:hypothetical protein n=1 Tax=Pseudoflavonifractor sp. 524-17 TaxID=2304577 RepID=UPI00137A1A52|nr:hypothetical protein [Pseudoflavonifractor sp. 524-17]NCE66502.1 hypothetical protein [Pseudoflavonifractor sp. 524-17]
MMLSEFVERTGFEPMPAEYAKIEEAYCGFNGDKDAFCKAFVAGDGEKKIYQARAAEIDRLNGKILDMDKTFQQSSAEYERECRKHDLSTERVPFQRNGRKYIALITRPPKTESSVETWALLTATGTMQLLHGIINGVNANYLGKLAAQGYFQCNQNTAQQHPEQMSLF